MIHGARIQEIRERLLDIDHSLDVGFSAEVETNLFNEQNELQRELDHLEDEAEAYHQGYGDGVEYHLGSGQLADYQGPHYDVWRRGVDAAGDDS